MIKRPFNKALYDAYDKPARDTLASYLEEQGHTVVSNEEDYNVDLVTQKGDFTYFNEVEVKTAWKGDWPSHWAEIRIPERKKRLLQHHKGAEGFLNFYIFSFDMSKVWRIKDTLLTHDSLREASGRYIRPGEKFFHIPYTEAELVTL